MPVWQELPLLVVVAFCLAVLIRTFLVQAFYIPSGSMENALGQGDRVLVNRVQYELRSPQRGEVVVFRGTSQWAPEAAAATPSVGGRVAASLSELVGLGGSDEDFIKRVIGLPGDRVACCDLQGRVTVNGVGLDEPYIKADSSLDLSVAPCGTRRFAEVVVPDGQLFVMGDNRLVSLDSRCEGTVPIANVIGRAVAVAWPLGHWGGIGAAGTLVAAGGLTALSPRVGSAVSRRLWWTRTLRK